MTPTFIVVLLLAALLAWLPVYKVAERFPAGRIPLEVIHGLSVAVVAMYDHGAETPAHPATIIGWAVAAAFYSHRENRNRFTFLSCFLLAVDWRMALIWLVLALVTLKKPVYYLLSLPVLPFAMLMVDTSRATLRGLGLMAVIVLVIHRRELAQLVRQ